MNSKQGGSTVWDSDHGESELVNTIRSQREYMRDIRRRIHRNPELGFEEHNTAKLVADELKNSGLPVRPGVGGTGVTAVLDGSGTGPCVLLRFDMDALPIHEESEVDFVSQRPGVSHACGHDGHVAIGLAVARTLARLKEEIDGSIMFVFQPAEELLRGAKAMLDDGALAQMSPDYALSLHLWNGRPVGWIGTADGAITAGGDSFSIRIEGVGGHGAHPHETTDVVSAAAYLVTGLQSVIARNIDPLDSAVLSVTQIHGGDTFNVIPSSVELGGTVRSHSSGVRDLVLGRLAELSQRVAEGFGCKAEVRTTRLTEPVINDPEVVATVRRALTSVLPESEIERGFRTMASEDASYFHNDLAGCYFYIGSANDDAGLDAKHHTSGFDFDESALEIGALAMVAAVRALISNHPVDSATTS